MGGHFVPSYNREQTANLRPGVNPPAELSRVRGKEEWDMTYRRARWALLCVLVLAVARGAWAGDETLAAAYSAILRGDYESGRATIDRLLEAGADGSAQRVHHWLECYHSAVARRNELKSATFAWNVEQARQALAEGRDFLALSFLTQAVPYAANLEDLHGAEWVRQLVQQCRAAALRQEEQDHWASALNYYMLLTRIFPEDEQLKELYERATRHARIELIYKDEEALQERIKGVDRKLLRSAVRMIEQVYYQQPDFRTLARGALDNLGTLANTTGLRKFLDGLGNPALREHFLARIRELRDQVTREKTCTDQDLVRLFNQVADLNRASVELPEGLLVVEFLEGALRELDDYSGMIWPADAADFDKVMMGGFEGVGIQLGVDERTSRLKVITPLENSPALEKGIQPDDLIIAVDGESTAGWTTDDAVRKIMGPAGSTVRLTIRRSRTNEELSFDLVRRKITITTVRGYERLPGNSGGWNYMLDPEAGVAYIRLSGFHPDSTRELREALGQAQNQGMKGLVLDIRHNPGGLLDTAIQIVSTFLDKGDVVSTRGRLEAERRELVKGDAPYRDLPLVVLVNEGSASASEILAGALQDHHRAIILGDRTFGKGSVQHVRPLSEDARLKLTTALYYLPSGRSPHKAPKAEQWGIDPDWELKLTPKEFRRVLERERKSFIIHTEPAGTEAPPSESQPGDVDAGRPASEESDEPPLLNEEDIERLEADPNDAPDFDPQLETALLLIRVKLASGVPWPAELASAIKQKPGPR